jgi:hypothetical protein
MTYSAPFLRLVASGTLYTDEGWSWSLSFMRNFAPEAVAPETVPAGVISAISTAHAAAGMISNTCKLDTIKLNEIDVNGRYVDQGNTVVHYITSPIAGNATTKPAPQTAYAVTVRTALQRGRAHAGRFYLPAPGFVLGTDGRVSVANAIEAVGVLTTMVNSIHTALAGDWRLAVVSNVGTGAVQVATHLSGGRVIDTIRSRRTSLDEDYQDGAALAT